MKNISAKIFASAAALVVAVSALAMPKGGVAPTRHVLKTNTAPKPIGGDSETRASGATAPKLTVVGPATIDLGAYPAREKREAVFELRNAGDASLVIRSVRETCGCAKTQLSRDTVPPGETATITITMLAGAIKGPYSKDFYVDSDDPKQRFFTLRVAGNARPLADILPKDTLYAGRLKVGDLWRQVFEIVPTAPNVELDSPIVDCAYPLKAYLSRRENGHYLVECRLTPFDAGPDLNAKITLPVRAPSEWEPLVIRVSATVGKGLLPLPDKIHLPSRISGPTTLSLKLRLLGGMPGEPKPNQIFWDDTPGMDVSFTPEGETDVQAHIVFSENLALSVEPGKTMELEFHYPQARPARVHVFRDVPPRGSVLYRHPRRDKALSRSENPASDTAR